MPRLFYIFLLSAFMILQALPVKACQCPITSLSMAECDKYELIFKGRIKTLRLNGEKSEAIFTIEELYKGNSAPTFKILFNNNDPCKIDLRPNDGWIIYCNYYQLESAKLDFCSRSRKFIANIKEDFFYSTTNITFDEESKFLQTNLGLHKLLKENINRVENRNQLPNKTQFVVILICSLLGIIFFYWLFNRLFK